MLDENTVQAEDETDSPPIPVDFSIENRRSYKAALKHVNDFHQKLNQLNTQTTFKLPEIPDYACWFEVLWRSQTKHEAEERSCKHNKNIVSSSTPILKHPTLEKNPRSEGDLATQAIPREYLSRFLSVDYSDAESEAAGAKLCGADAKGRKIWGRSRNGNVLDMIKDRLLQEFLEDFQSKRTKLSKACFGIVDIQPGAKLLEQTEQHSELHVQTIVRPNTPRRVKQMFDVISRDNLAPKNPHLDLSDSDSVILDDEEFEKLKLKPRHQEEVIPERRGKSNPLKLTGKDMTRLNEKMLSAIGLFTERGDVRPGVIDFLEEQKKLKSNDSRNKQFRSKRQWDIQIHLKPKRGLESSLPSVSSDRSFISLSSDIKLQVQNVESFESNE